MWIGAARIVLEYFGNTSAVKKRTELEALCADLRKQYNISAIEVDAFDDPEKCVLGFSVVIPASWKPKSASQFVEKILRMIDSTAFARVTVEDWEIIPFWGGGRDAYTDYDEGDELRTPGGFQDRGGRRHLPSGKKPNR